MKNEEIIEGNKLIDGFMDSYKSGSLSDDAWLNGVKYHTSWSWLMPVVEKIETLTNPESNYTDHYFVTTIEPGYCVISENGEAPVCQVIGDEETKIQIVWECVIKFIKWYNDSTPTVEDGKI